MAHYAMINPSYRVMGVIVGGDESDTSIDWEAYYPTILKHNICKRTSYNTIGGVHTLGGTPFRKNYAGVGYTYDTVRDAFIPPIPYASWTLNEDTCHWDCPVDYPTEIEDADGNPILYSWNEEDQQWDVIS